MATTSGAPGMRFVLYSMPRTGSNMVLSLLRQHPDITCLAAIFGLRGWTKREDLRPNRIGGQPHRLATLPKRFDQQETRISEMDELLERLLELYADKPRFGFKHHFGGPHYRPTHKLIARGWPAIILTRENILASYSSGRLVEITGQGAVRAGQKPKRAKAVFDGKEFDRFQRQRQEVYSQWPKKIEESGVPMMTIDYCEARTPGGMARVGRFLEVEAEHFGKPGTAKRNSDDILSRFTNPDEARAWLEANGRMDWAVED